MNAVEPTAFVVIPCLTEPVVETLGLLVVLLILVFVTLPSGLVVVVLPFLEVVLVVLLILVFVTLPSGLVVVVLP